MSWNTQFSMASKGGIQEMERVTITSQFYTVSVCCLCFLFTVVTFSVTAMAATKKVLMLGNNITKVEAPTISKGVKKVKNYTFDYEITQDSETRESGCQGL